MSFLSDQREAFVISMSYGWASSRIAAPKERGEQGEVRNPTSITCEMTRPGALESKKRYRNPFLRIIGETIGKF